MLQKFLYYASGTVVGTFTAAAVLIYLGALYGLVD